MSTISINPIHVQTPTSIFISTNPLIVPTVIAGTALALYQYQGLEVGMARERLNVPAPATTGAHGEFDLIFRSHANMAESLVSFIPTLFGFSLLVSEKWATILGSTWIVGRILFHLGYKSSAGERKVGALISNIAEKSLLVGVLYVAGKRLYERYI
eukprot:TRINITY_DN197_c0_g1_i1.p1 TRINITY_DN197_c0_g1~~TRINITY_DN197_c0_g1_i1.p1  ORF type:complete len:177 (+),score=55.35 TRINITY_DN197_c0_g1_i1:66-533(+)